MDLANELLTRAAGQAIARSARQATGGLSDPPQSRGVSVYWWPLSALPWPSTRVPAKDGCIPSRPISLLGSSPSAARFTARRPARMDLMRRNPPYLIGMPYFAKCGRLGTPGDFGSHEGGRSHNGNAAHGIERHRHHRRYQLGAPLDRQFQKFVVLAIAAYRDELDNRHRFSRIKNAAYFFVRPRRPFIPKTADEGWNSEGRSCEERSTI